MALEMSGHLLCGSSGGQRHVYDSRFDSCKLPDLLSQVHDRDFVRVAYVEDLAPRA